ncbi:MAG: helix-turn-helix domain-containing protein [Armatimonadetes bacterium]|nr:helix-turn-helix domain-containing protein [Armatimonadota bacterium]
MRVQTRQLHHITLLSVVERILSDPGCDLDEVLLGFSRDHFNRFFRDAMGEPLYEFARRIRLERAAQELRSGKLTSSVALEAGYATPEAFTKAFRSEFGVAPSSFAKGAPARRALDSTRAHWGDKRAPLSIDPVTNFGASLLTLQDLEIAAIDFRGDYTLIPAEWESLSSKIPHEARQSNTWLTVFHSDGMRTSARHEMAARMGYLYTGGYLLPGFERFTIPGGSYVASSVISGRKEHSEAWAAFNRLWVPKSGPRPPDYPAFDLYEAFPAPFAEVHAAIHLRLE